MDTVSKSQETQQSLNQMHILWDAFSIMNIDLYHPSLTVSWFVFWKICSVTAQIFKSICAYAKKGIYHHRMWIELLLWSWYLVIYFIFVNTKPVVIQIWKLWLIITHPSPGQHGRHFADSVFKCIFVNEKFCISIKISLKFVPKGPVENNPALVQNGLAPNRRQVIIWSTADPIHQHIYAALVRDNSCSVNYCDITDFSSTIFFKFAINALYLNWYCSWVTLTRVIYFMKTICHGTYSCHLSSDIAAPRNFSEVLLCYMLMEDMCFDVRNCHVTKFSRITCLGGFQMVNGIVWYQKTSVIILRWIQKPIYRADSRLAPSQWETSLQSNGISHWMGASLESALIYMVWVRHFQIKMNELIDGTLKQVSLVQTALIIAC